MYLPDALNFVLPSPSYLLFPEAGGELSIALYQKMTHALRLLDVSLFSHGGSRVRTGRSCGVNSAIRVHTMLPGLVPWRSSCCASWRRSIPACRSKALEAPISMTRVPPGRSHRGYAKIRTSAPDGGRDRSDLGIRTAEREFKMSNPFIRKRPHSASGIPAGPRPPIDGRWGSSGNHASTAHPCSCRPDERCGRAGR